MRGALAFPAMHAAEVLAVLGFATREEIELTERSPIAGRSLRETQLRDRTGALVLAVREPDGTFRTNPPPDTRIHAGQVIIAIGTQQELDALAAYVAG